MSNPEKLNLEKLAFRIRYYSNSYYCGYKVSIPNYNGGEVVPLEHVNQLVEIARHAKRFVEGDNDGLTLSVAISEFEKSHGEL